MTDILAIADQCVSKAMSLGADAADAIIFDSRDVTVRQRMRQPETIERSESQAVGLRVLIGKPGGYRQAIVSSSDISTDSLNTLVNRAVDMAKIAPTDPYIGLADQTLLANNIAKLDLVDNNEPSVETLKDWAKEAEEAALAVEGVTNSDGADASYGSGSAALVTSHGFSHCYDSTSFSVSTSVVSGEGQSMETDYDYSVARHAADMRAPSEIGKYAGERAVRRLNPRNMRSCQVPLVFEARLARSVLGSFSGAVNGASVARGSSFLKDKMGEAIFAKNINIIDDPLRVRGLSSEPFDAEGVAGEKRHMVKDGVLQSWFLDVRSAAQLGLQTTGHASRGISSPPSPGASNLYMEAGEKTPEELIAEIEEGFFVTEAFGMGINGVTGDYSQGAGGFWIEKGEIVFPVSELTIAGNLNDMFKRLTPANDLEFRYGTNAPTIRIDGMTVAGKGA